jgi:hypothetical protein
MNRRPSFAGQLLVALALLLVSPPLSAQGADRAADPSPERDRVELGLLLGGGFYHLNAPEDPAGATTFLFGSAFSGGGFTVGPSAAFELMPWLGLGVDLLFSTVEVTGNAESGDLRREVSFSEQTLRLDLLARLILPLEQPEIDIGLGVELALPLASGVSESVTGFDPGADPPLESTSSVWVLPLAHLGVSIRLGRVTIPLALRLGWNPAYPDTTAERFETFASVEEPGPFTVGVDWYVGGLVGVRFAL